MKKKQISEHAAAAKAIRQYMKARGIAGSVSSDSFTGGTSVRAKTQDLLPESYKELRDFARQFQFGHFDSMQDICEYSNTRDDIPQVKYVFVDNSMSDAMRQSIWDFARGYYSGLENAPANANEAGKYYIEKMGRYGDKLIYQLFSGDWTSAYWDHVKEQTKKAA